jgi:hypothetical protein
MPHVSASDNFDRADAGTLGANWTQLAGTLTIASNRSQQTGGFWAVAIWAPDAFPPDQWSEAKVFNNYPGVGTRLASDGGAAFVGYAVEVNHLSGNVALLRWDGGFSQTNIGNFPGEAGADGDTFRLESIGSTHTVYHNGVAIGFAVDATYATGQVGLYSQDGGTHDDWVAASIESNAPVPFRTQIGAARQWR